MTELKNRIDFVYVFDVQDGNPNAENFPVEISNSAQTFKTIAYRGIGGSLGSCLFGAHEFA